MNDFFLLDFVVFVYLLFYFLVVKLGLLGCLVGFILDGLGVIFSFETFLRQGVVISRGLFGLLFLRCFCSYFCYSFCFCGIGEVVLVCAVISWLGVLLVFISGEKFCLYLNGVGDIFLKSFGLFFVELVREVSRPLALTVRLTVNVMVGHLIAQRVFELLEFKMG